MEPELLGYLYLTFLSRTLVWFFSIKGHKILMHLVLYLGFVFLLLIVFKDGYSQNFVVFAMSNYVLAIFMPVFRISSIKGFIDYNHLILVFLGSYLLILAFGSSQSGNNEEAILITSLTMAYQAHTYWVISGLLDQEKKMV